MFVSFDEIKLGDRFEISRCCEGDCKPDIIGTVTGFSLGGFFGWDPALDVVILIDEEGGDHYSTPRSLSLIDEEGGDWITVDYEDGPRRVYFPRSEDEDSFVPEPVAPRPYPAGTILEIMDPEDREYLVRVIDHATKAGRLYYEVEPTQGEACTLFVQHAWVVAATFQVGAS